MVNKIKILFERFTISLVKTREMLLFVIVENVILTLLMLIYANIIISNGAQRNELDYGQVKFFYNLAIASLFIIVSIFAPHFLSDSVNKLIKNNTMEYLLSEKVAVTEIVYALYIRGLINVIVLLVSAIPIISVSFFFGGVGLTKIFRVMTVLLGFSIIITSTSIYISAKIKDTNISKMTSYILTFILLTGQFFILKQIISYSLISFLYLLFSIILGLVLLTLVSKENAISI